MGRTRRPDGEPTHAQSPSTSAELNDLIEGVRNVRRSLDTDLTTAAAALDVGREDVAKDIIDGSLADVAAFRAAAIARLNAEPAMANPRPARTRRLQSRRARALITIPAIPLVGALAMGAAAAISDLGAPAAHHHHTSAATTAIAAPITHPSATPTAASTTLARLERVVAHHPQSSQVVAVANDLHQQLTRIITTASQHPNQLGVVTRLLNVEQRVLKTNHAPGASIALAAARQVRELLHKTTLPTLSLTNPLPSSTHPTTATTKKPTSTTKTTSKKSRRTTSKSAKHHKHSTHPKHKTRTTTPTPRPSNPLFGSGVFGVFS